MTYEQKPFFAGTYFPKTGKYGQPGLHDLLRQNFDQVYEGFGHAPKFPTPHNLLFLMRIGITEDKPEALQITECTLQDMSAGGIFDHIGGGFYCGQDADSDGIEGKYYVFTFDVVRTVPGEHAVLSPFQQQTAF